MNIISSKKITYHIESLSYFNALNWFWRVEDLLEGKNLWTSINDVITDWKAQESAEKNENTKSTSLSEAVAAETAKTEWKRKNFKAKTIIAGLISESDINTIRTQELRYADDIWLYLKVKYTRTTHGMLTAIMRNFTRWKKNPAHTMKKAAQEIEAIADWVSQLGDSTLNSFLVKHQFLSGLPDEYESARQILESQDAKMREIIIRLIKIELWLRRSNNIIEDELAMRAKNWMKIIRCYNCQKTGHIAKYCPHNKDSDNEESENEKPRRKLGKKSKKKHVWVVRELFISDSESV